MKYKEIDECVKELGNYYNKLHKRYCEGNKCTNCFMGNKDDLCTLLKIKKIFEELEEKQQ